MRALSFVGCVVLMIAQPVMAQSELGSLDATPREIEAQVQLEVGVRLAGQGRCEHAIERFERALALVGTAATRFHLGACQHALGRHAEAIEQLERFVAAADPEIDAERTVIAARILERARAELQPPIVAPRPTMHLDAALPDQRDELVLILGVTLGTVGAGLLGLLIGLAVAESGTESLRPTGVVLDF